MVRLWVMVSSYSFKVLILVFFEVKLPEKDLPLRADVTSLLDFFSLMLLRRSAYPLETCGFCGHRTSVALIKRRFL